MARLRLRPDVAIRVDADDRTAFGSPTTMRPQTSTRQLFHPVIDHVKQNGYADLVGIGPRLLADVVHGPKFSEITSPVGNCWEVNSDVVFPDPEQARFRWLTFVSAGGPHLRATLRARDWPLAHQLVADLASGRCAGDDPDRHPDMQRLLEGLSERGLVEPSPGGGPPRPEEDITFVGHNTVIVRTESTRLVVDPLLFAGSPGFGDDYQPLSRRDLGPIDAIVVTHSHPDHFDPASLLQFAPETLVIVPALERETILAVDMARRLAELGFTNVKAMAWHTTARVGDICVHALPFYGEQPSDGDVLHPDVRNQGNTYVVQTPTFAAAFLADSGRDHRGDVHDVASAWRRDHGPIDVVFSGYRGWSTFPVQLLFSSVAAFILFVPPWLWGARLRLMNDVAGALDVAERWGARYLVPYADGGAPWHWGVGLGPRLDGSGIEDVDFDPFPDRVEAAASRRAQVPGGRMLSSPVEVRLLRPGDSMADVAGQSRVVRVAGHAWPY